MHLCCQLRPYRGTRTLREIADQSGVSVPALSQIERGILVPKDAEIVPLEDAYGAKITDWYDRPTLLALRTGDGAE